jgi:CDP-2,3-bis-(O-geranylgeranyl)-sn-glycerol synthase
MLDVILTTLFLFFPAYLGNSLPLLLSKVQKLAFLKVPLDGRKMLGGNPIFGDHKTWLGVVAGCIGGMLAVVVEIGLLFSFPSLKAYFLFEYHFPLILVFGLLMGLGAIVGDAVKSFFKRRLSIKSGGVFFPFDQIDFVIGAYIFGLLFWPLPWLYLGIALLITPLLHFISNVAAYKMKLKEVWW